MNIPLGVQLHEDTHEFIPWVCGYTRVPMTIPLDVQLHEGTHNYTPWVCGYTRIPMTIPPGCAVTPGYP